MNELRIVNLGASGLRVTELCFGTLTLSPIQADLSPGESGSIIRQAICEGVSFIDTAQGYKNYPHVRAGIQGCDRARLVIATKSLARSAEGMQKAFDEACEQMGVEYLDIFHLHMITSAEDFNARKGALETLKELKSRGLVKAIGISVHNVQPLRCVLGNRDIDICHPIVNKDGLGIKDGTISDMMHVINKLHDEGKGIYAMKPLGGGHLIDHAVEAFDFIRGCDAVDAVAVGMKDKGELAFNLACFRGQEITGEMRKSVSIVNRRLFINSMCKKCGSCIDACEQDALHMGKARMEIDPGKCIMCGYCVPHCQEFAMRII